MHMLLLSLLHLLLLFSILQQTWLHLQIKQLYWRQHLQKVTDSLQWELQSRSALTSALDCLLHQQKLLLHHETKPSCGRSTVQWSAPLTYQ